VEMAQKMVAKIPNKSKYHLVILTGD